MEPLETAGRKIANSIGNKVPAILYLVGGVFGAINAIAQLNGASLNALSTLAWLILIAQIAGALYGGWCHWNRTPIGAQILFWLSVSLVPVISTNLISYWCAMGLGFLPVVTFGPGTFSTDFNIRFGYVAQLWFAADDANAMLGVNVVAILLVVHLKRALTTIGVPAWPLHRLQGSPGSSSTA